MSDVLKKASVAAQQAVMRFSGNQTVVIDGIWGPRSQRAFDASPQPVREAARAAKTGVENAIRTHLRSNPSANVDFMADVVPTIIAVAERRGLDGEAVAAQVAHESGWGRSKLSKQYHNYGGMKYNTTLKYPGKKPGSTQMMTTERLDGRDVRLSDGFATFDSPQHFAEVYVWYLLDGPSSYRYRGIQSATGREYFEVLQRGGYATDPKYAANLDGVLRSVQRQLA